jgi:tetratricopeptide (TPR) repeat protein
VERVLNSFIFDYYDPIYSILLLILIATVIALVSQGWIVYKKEKSTKNLYSFLDKFDDTSCELEERDVPFDAGMQKPLLLLARAFEQSGDYAKSINIFLYLIRHSKDDELLVYLGKIYLKAGFLQRAEEIFVQLLKRHPRRKDVLYQLELIYETLGDFESAKETIDVIEAQGGSVKLIREYLKYLEIKGDRNLNSAEKIERLKEILLKSDEFFRIVIKELFLIDSKSAWEMLNSSRVEDILDILWYLPESKLQLDIILSDDILSCIYFARGDINHSPKSDSRIFAIDILSKARESGYTQGDISFLYLCKSCKNSFPISFERCPNCMEINSIKVEETLEKRREKRGDSLL